MKQQEHQEKSGQTAGRTRWLEVADVACHKLTIKGFSAADGEGWCLLGDNSSGIDLFVRLLSGDPELRACSDLLMPDDLAVVSFRSQQEIFEAEVRNDDSDLLDRIDPGTPAREFIGQSDEIDELTRLFHLEHVLDSGYRQLSSGESRKLLILGAVSHGARHLLLENPYDGLDVKSCHDLDCTLARLFEKGFGIIITVTSRNDVPPWCTHLGLFKAGTFVSGGVKQEVLEDLAENGDADRWADILAEGMAAGKPDGQELVRIVSGRARYGEKTIFSGLDFAVQRGEHTLITGPNGAGKSTLLSLITGDHPDCYTNEMYLFGRRRGSGESIWQLKKEMGIVSPALHREHYIPGNTLQIVISGFFDSIGLYRQHTVQQADLARKWLGLIGLEDQETTPFRRLSYSWQRLALIARALIKMPQLLILDEPTQGLDDRNRRSLLDFLESVAERDISTILYVSHRQDEYRDFFRSHLDLS